MTRLDNEIAIVTGAGSGIGRAIACELAESGAAVALVGRREGPLTETAALINRSGGRAIVCATDISKSDAVMALMKETTAKLGPVTILINNAGSVVGARNISFTKPEDWQSTVDTNLTAVYLLSRAVLNGMIEAGGGTIVTISSGAALRPNMLGGAAYGAAKAGVRNLMGYLHNTFRNQGIRATTITPGEVNTPILDTRPRPPTSDERAALMQPEDVAAAVLLCCTLPKRTVIEEIIMVPTRMRDQSADVELARWFGAPAGTKK